MLNKLQLLNTLKVCQRKINQKSTSWLALLYNNKGFCCTNQVCRDLSDIEGHTLSMVSHFLHCFTSLIQLDVERLWAQLHSLASKHLTLCLTD